MDSIFDELTTNKILKRASAIKAKQQTSPTLYLFAGLKNSGKSSVAATMYFDGNLKVPFINFDFYKYVLFASHKQDLLYDDKLNDFLSKKIELYLENKCSFCFEIANHNDYVFELIKSAKQNGFKIVTIFVNINNPSIIVGRSQNDNQKVAAGTLLEDFYNHRNYCKNLKQECDYSIDFDNSKTAGISTLSNR